jgi:hypothetical protein
MLEFWLGSYGDLNGSCISLRPTEVYACTNSFNTKFGLDHKTEEN